MNCIWSRSLIVLAAMALTAGSWAVAQADSSHAGSTEPSAAAAEIPDLPFEDNPDPEACGIPQRVGSDDTAWLHGEYQGELIEPVVHLYDSHLRNEITGRAPSGTQVEVILFQDNPVLDYYMVEATLDDGSMQKGWVPAPFLSFERP